MKKMIGRLVFTVAFMSMSSVCLVYTKGFGGGFATGMLTGVATTSIVQAANKNSQGYNNQAELRALDRENRRLDRENEKLYDKVDRLQQELVEAQKTIKTLTSQVTNLKAEIKKSKAIQPESAITRIKNEIKAELKKL